MVRFALPRAIIKDVEIRIHDDQTQEAVIHLPIDKVTPIFHDHEHVDVVISKRYSEAELEAIKEQHKQIQETLRGLQHKKITQE